MAGKMEVTVQVHRTRNLGSAGDIEVSLAQFGVAIADETLVFIRLAERCDAMLDMYIKNTPALEINGSQARDGQILSGNVTEEWLPANGISVTMRDGKKLYKVKGGRYSEHGVNFFEEHMKLAGFGPKDIPDSGYTFRQETWMLVQFEGGQAKRVLKLSKEAPNGK